jgi:WD40 repeat protein/serine/threonine protein kinase/Flp pilus assembly protein TadD
MTMSELSADRNPVEQLAEEFAERHRRGEHPALSEYTARYPQWADQIRDLFPALVVMEQLKPAPGEATGDYRGGPPRAGGLALERLGDYRILREVGRGGMGIVYEAEQESLGRHVALKVLPAHALLDGRQLHRFRREARSAARLHHTNIVPVYGVGEHNGLHYYVMQFIQGLGLDAVLAELRHVPRPGGRRGAALTEAAGTAKATRAGDVSAAAVARSLWTGAFARPEAAPDDGPDPTPLPESRPADTPAEPARTRDDSSAVHLPGQPEHSTLSDSGRHYWQSVARIGLQVAEALAYAHAQGVLHRDIKPSNLLVDTHGTVWVTDFGLAKGVADEENLTHTGDLVGTLRYMSPERFHGQADARADIYGLGLTLYELLVLRPVFEESDRNRLIHQITHAEPPPPRKLNRQVPRDLETVVLKAIARDPAHRYQAATELAEDLRRFLEDKPIRARRVSQVEQLWRWCRRNPAVASLAATAVVLLATVAVVATVGYVQTTMAQEGADKARREARLAQDRQVEAEQATRVANAARRQAQRKEAEAKKQYLSYFTNLAGYYLERGRKAARDEGDLGQALLFLARALEIVPAHEKDLQTVIRANLAAWARRQARPSLSGKTRDGRIVGLAGEALTGRLPELGDVPVPFPHQPGPAHGPLASLTEGRPLSRDEREALWDLGDKLPNSPEPNPVAVAFSPDGKTLLTGGATGLRLWDVLTGRLIRTIPWTGGDLSVARFSRDGKVIWAAGQQQAQRWDAATARPLGHPIRFTDPAGWVIPSPDGKTLLKGEWNSGRGRNEVQLFSLTDRAPIGGPIPTALSVNMYVRGDMQVLFSPDGKTLVTRERRALPVAVPQLAARGNETRFQRDFVRVWDTATGKPLEKPLGPFDSLSAVAFGDRGRMLLAADWNGNRRRYEIQRWDVETGKPLGAISLAGAPALFLAMSPGGKTVAVVGPQDIRLFNALTGERLAQPFRPPGMPIIHIHGAINPNTRIDVHYIQDTVSATLPALAFSPDGQMLLTGSADGTAQLWNVATGAPLGEPLRRGSPIEAVSFSPNGRTALTQGTDKTVRLWDLTDRLGIPLRHPGPVRAAALSPKGDLGLVGGADGTARLWDVRKRRPVGRALRHPGPVHAGVFSPDGKFLLTGCAPDPTGAQPGEGEARLWEVATGKLRRVFRQPGAVLAVAFSADGQRILTGGKSATARVWDAATGRPVGEPLVHPRGPVFAVAFHPDGKTVVTGCEDGKVRRWDPATGKPVGKPLSHDGPVYAVAYSPDGKTLFTGGENLKTGRGEGRFWDTATGKALGASTLKHQDPFLHAAFSPDGRTLLTGGGNWQRKRGSAQLWNVATGLPLAPPLAHQGRVSAVAFSPDGKRVLTGCDDSTARLWNVPPPVQGSPDRVRLWAQVRTGMELTEDNRAVALNPAERERRRWRLELLDNPGTSAAALAKRGRAYSRLAETGKALRAYTRALRRKHDDARLWAERARVHLRSNRAEDWQKAAADFTEALRRRPADRALWLERAAVYRRLHEWAKEAADLGRALALRPDDPQLYLDRGRALVRCARWKAAAADFAKALDLLPPDAHQREAIYTELAGWERAFSRVTELRPKDARLWVTRARIRHRGGLAGAAQDFDKAVGLQPHDPGLRLERGAAYAQDGKWSEAAADFAKALEGLPEDSPGHAALCARVTKWPAAFPRLLALRPDDAQLRIAAGRMYAAHRQWEQAAAAFARALELLRRQVPQRDWDLRQEIARSDELCARVLALRPREAELWEARGRVEARRGQWARAGAAFAKAAELRPDDGMLWHRQACALLHSGAVADYRRLCTRLLKRHGDTKEPNLAYWVVRTCTLGPDATEDPARLVSLAERLRATGSKDGAVAALAGRVLGPAYYRAGRFGEAVRQLHEILIEGRPGGPAFTAFDWLWLAMAQQRRGQADKARQYLAKFEQLAREFGATPAAPQTQRDLVQATQRDLGQAWESVVGDPTLLPPVVPRNPPAIVMPWEDWAEYGFLRAEAVGLISPHHAELERARKFAENLQWDKAADALSKALARKPDDLPLYLERARHYARLGRWAEARADYAKGLGSQPPRDEWFELACLDLVTGDVRAYRRKAARVARDFGATKDAFTAYVAARIAVLTPDSGVDPARAMRWARQAVTDQPKAWYLHCLGLACYRAGQYREAVRHFEASLQAQVDWPGRFLNWLGLALAHQRLGRPQEARRWSDKATAWLDAQAAGKQNPASAMPVPDWLEYQVLRRETEALRKSAAKK